MPTDLKGYRVFIASPGGLDTERRSFRSTIVDYNEMDALPRGAMFIPVGWEVTLGGLGRPQSLINEEVRKCDYFVLLLWDRWGSPPDPGGADGYTSGTEEEYNVALECFYNDDAPMRNIIVLFKAVDPRQLADPGPQLSKVLEFKKQLERDKTLFFHTYDEVAEFERTLRQHLAQWVRDHEDGTRSKVLQPQPPTPPSVTLPPAEEPAAPPPVPTAASSPEARLIHQAKGLADEGRLTEAEALFTRASVKGDNLNAMNEYAHFLTRVGRLAQGEVLYQRILELATAAGDLEWQAKALGNLGAIYRTRGDLDQGEAVLRKALVINERLGRREGMAIGYGNLGAIYQTRGDLDQAEAMHREALAIAENLGWLEGMASQYGNLGVIYQTRGDLDQAEAMHCEALAIHDQFARLEGMASEYGNLGLIYQTRGDLDQAEAMHRKALAIDEKLGRLEGTASQYGNLAMIYQRRGDLDQAEAMLRKALEINEKLGRPEGMASEYGNLGLIYRARGDLDQAEAMHRKSLAIEEKLGRLEGMANAYGNLGTVFMDRGDFESARQHWTKAHDLYGRIGMPHMVKQLRGWLDGLEKKED